MGGGEFDMVEEGSVFFWDVRNKFINFTATIKCVLLSKHRDVLDAKNY